MTLAHPSHPTGDIHTLSIDPFIHAELHVPTQPRARDDPPLTFRTPTIRQNRDPDWNAEWIVSGIPSEGFLLKMKVKDEDPSTRDDSAGHAVADFRKAGVVTDEFAISEATFDIKKRRASPQVYVQTYVASILPRIRMSIHGHVIISIRVVGRAPDQNHKSAYTVGPSKFLHPSSYRHQPKYPSQMDPTLLPAHRQPHLIAPCQPQILRLRSRPDLGPRHRNIRIHIRRE